MTPLWKDLRLDWVTIMIQSRLMDGMHCIAFLLILRNWVAFVLNRLDAFAYD
jgi:hypothetical protein